MAESSDAFRDTAATIARRQQKFESKYQIEFKRDRARAQLFVLSFPKSGRTWHRLLLGSYLAARCKKPSSEAFNLETLCKTAGAKSVIYSHNGANFIDWLEPTHPFVASSSLWVQKPVLLLVRNPRDILVSAYHHAKFRSHTYSGSLSESVRDRRVGIEKVLTAFNRWYAGRRLAASFTVISYEQMYRTPNQILRTTLALADVSPIDEALVSEAVDFCAFEKMQAYERNGYFNTPRLRVKSADIKARKVRQGRVGAFKDFLSSSDESYIESAIAEIGDPFRDYTVVNGDQ
jgi:alcohol sulfotransferase